MFSSNTSQVADGAANFIEECFSTFLYSGNGSTQTITNGIDLAGKGGLVWTKIRSNNNIGFTPNVLIDTARGFNFSSTQIRSLFSNTMGGESDSTLNNAQATALSNGFSYATSAGNEVINGSGFPYVSWTFREQPKFFDMVTWTGNDVQGRQINHALGSVPGCIIIKCTSGTTDWVVHHRSLGFTQVVYLNSTAAAETTTRIMGATSTTFTVSDSSATNSGTQTYVAYLFAHNAGGFGLTGTDNVISCGSFTANANTTVDLGYEPQWILFKNTNASLGWGVVDVMRTWTAGGNANVLFPNTSAAESAESGLIRPTATGFQWIPAVSGNNYIYIAIRRGPMKVPTTGTSVYAGQLQSPPGGSSILAANSGFPIDMLISRVTASVQSCFTFTRLQGNEFLATASTAAAGTATYGWDNMAGVRATWDASSGTVSWAFRRAPSVMDVVCYTGTGANRTVAHNLTVAPELIIFKARNLTGENWGVWVPAFGFSSGILWLNSNGGVIPLSDRITGTSATTVSTGTNPELNNTGTNYVMYLFATCPGVSKVGSYTGNGSSQTINCGFTGGARFVLVKRTNSSGNWMVVDTARGLVSAGDPTLYLNSTAVEVTGNDWVDPDNSGFIVNQESVMNANVNGDNYIFLAIA